jgi:hypothetical protein
LRRDWDRIKGELGVEAESVPPFVGSVKRKRPDDWREMYDRESEGWVKDWCAEDVERWGYRFG